MGTYQEISAQTKQNLTDAFWALYCEKRMDKITVREITVKASYNRSTFYQYFKDVYDVLEQIENSLLPGLEDMPPLVMNTGNTRLPIDSFIKLYSMHGKYYTVLLGDNGDPAFAGKMKNGIKLKLIEQLATSSIDSMELDYSLEYILAAMIGVLAYWFKNNENMPEEQLINLMYGLINGDAQNKLALQIDLGGS